ncbi:MAG: thiamine-phosphate kinase [Methanobacterium sp.]|nr:thiamine-phosphate kinase [Methanobacterium sp.]
MPSEKYRITDLGEKEIIKRLLLRSQNIPFKSSFFDENFLKSLSDDAALIDFKDNYLVATSDMLTRSKHFPEEMSYSQIGKKIVTVNVSDLAAMGAETLGIILAMGLPSDLEVSKFDALIDGILQACEKYHMALIGGDTNESKELTLCGTCLGILTKDKVLMKSGAKYKDIVAVTGPLGLAAAGFIVLNTDDKKLKNLSPEVKDKVIKHALEPEAQLEKGLLLAKTGAITSATDITDGLLSEIDEIINSSGSGIGMTIYEELIPITSEVKVISHILKKNKLKMALSFGEDFQLLVTVNPDKFEEVKKDYGLYKIGHVNSSGEIRMIDKEGKTNILQPEGYEHFKKLSE